MNKQINLYRFKRSHGSWIYLLCYFVLCTEEMQTHLQNPVRFVFVVVFVSLYALNGRARLFRSEIMNSSHNLTCTHGRARLDDRHEAPHIIQTHTNTKTYGQQLAVLRFCVRNVFVYSCSVCNHRNHTPTRWFGALLLLLLLLLLVFQLKRARSRLEVH